MEFERLPKKRTIKLTSKDKMITIQVEGHWDTLHDECMDVVELTFFTNLEIKQSE